MRSILAYLLLICIGSSYAQHYQFSQFYAAPTYLNPAFTGANNCQRFGVNYRNQWSAIPGAFTSYQVTYDRPVRQINSGLGFSVFSDKAGLGSLKSTQFHGLYAYELKINKSLNARGGISAGFTQRSIDYSQLTFGDQIARGGNSATVDDISNTRNVYFDMNMGYLVYGEAFWGGFTIDHLARPNQSLHGGTSILPMEFKFHGGYKYVINDDPKEASEQHSFTAAMNYKRQLRFNQIDLGAYYNKGYLVVGVWYRGIPVYRPYSWYTNNDALVFLLGLSTEKMRIGYSYDYTVSKLTIANTAGTHEISFSYTMCGKKNKKKKRQVLISCPKF